MNATRPATTRSPRAAKEARTLMVGNLAIHLDTFEVTVDGEVVDLSYNDFDLLSALISEKDRIVSRDEILRKMSKEPEADSDRNLSVAVHRLRRKLSGLQPYEIRTVRGRGYGLVAKRASRPRLVRSQ